MAGSLVREPSSYRTVVMVRWPVSVMASLRWRMAFTYDFSSCFFPKFKIMHFQNRDIKLYTVVLLFLCFLKFLLKLCCR